MTTQIILTPEAAILPSAAAATLTPVTSSASAPAEAPKVTYNKLVYADAADSFALWNMPIPADFLAGFPFNLTLWWGAAVNAGNVIWDAGVLAAIAASTDLDAAAFAQSDAFPATAVPATIGQFKKTTLTLTSTGAIAGGFLSLFIGRNGNAGGDTAAGNAELIGAILDYTA